MFLVSIIYGFVMSYYILTKKKKANEFLKFCKWPPIPLFNIIVQAALSTFGLPCAFLGKSDLYSFSWENYMPFKKKDVSNFLLPN